MFEDYHFGGPVSTVGKRDQVNLISSQNFACTTGRLRPAWILAGPPKIDLRVCVGIFCAACMYVGGVVDLKKSQMYGNPSQVLTISTLELSELAEIFG